MRKVLLLSIILMLVFFSCKKDKNSVPPFTGYSYVPLNIGHEIIYDVDSTIKSDFDGLTHYNHFQIRELIADTFTDNQGRPTLRLERYKRLTPSDPWIIHKVWTANLTNIHYEKKEDNITFVKLTFPPVLNNTWNGNSLNTLGTSEYKYSDLNIPDSYNGLSFDSALTVLQNQYGDILDSVLYEEKYATGVGMYYKLQDSAHYNCCHPSQPFRDSILYRRIYSEKIVSFSN